MSFVAAGVLVVVVLRETAMVAAGSLVLDCVLARAALAFSVVDCMLARAAVVLPAECPNCDFIRFATGPVERAERELTGVASASSLLASSLEPHDVFPLL